MRVGEHNSRRLFGYGKREKRKEKTTYFGNCKRIVSYSIFVRNFARSVVLMDTLVIGQRIEIVEHDLRIIEEKILPLLRERAETKEKLNHLKKIEEKEKQ